MGGHGRSVAICDFDFVRAVGLPAEADAPLVVDANGMLAFAVSLECFEAIAGRDGQVPEFGDGVELSEFAQSNPLNVRREKPASSFLEKAFGIPTGEGADHAAGRFITGAVMFDKEESQEESQPLRPGRRSIQVIGVKVSILWRPHAIVIRRTHDGSFRSRPHVLTEEGSADFFPEDALTACGTGK